MPARVFIRPCASLGSTVAYPVELRVLRPPRLVPAEAKQGAERNLRSLPGLAELLEPEPPLHLGGVQAAPPLRQNDTNILGGGTPCARAPSRQTHGPVELDDGSL